MKSQAIAIAAAFAATSVFALPRKSVEITVSGYTGASSLKNFPVLVRISPERISGFSYADCAADGRDIAFADAEGNVLAREIDTWDPNGESLVWVSLPTFSSSTVFTMTYKDPTVAAQPPCQTNGAVWAAAGYVGVWHFGEDYGTAFDSTTNALHGAVDASYDQTCIAANDAKVGKSRYVPGAASVNLPNFSNLDIGDTVSLSGWYKFDPSVTLPSSTSPYLFTCKTKWDSTADGWYVVFQWTTNSDTTKKTLGLNGAGTTVSKVTVDSIKSSWVHITATFNNKTGAAYSNGVLKGSPTLNAAAKNLAASATPRMFTGSYTGFADEVRIRDAVNSADWVKAEYQTVAVDGFLSFGAAGTLFEGDSSLGVSPPFVVERGANYLLLQSEAYGVGAASTVKFLYGVAPDALTHTAIASASVTADGNFAATLTRFQPGTTYYVKAVVEENGGGASTESAVVSFQTADIAKVPSAYSTIEYIEGTGTQYIDTGYKPTPTTHTVIDFQFTTRVNQYRVFGLEFSNLYYSFYQNGSGNWAYTCQDSSGSWTALSPTKATDTNRHLFDFNFANADDLRCLTIDGGAVSSATGLVGTRSKIGSGSLVLGAARTAASTIGNISKHRIYSCQMYEEDVVVRDFVPVKRKADGVSGLYDLVEGAFHASAGTAAYVAGPVLFLEASEVVANDALASFALSCEASSSARSLRAAWGPVHGGDDPNDWYATSPVATVAAGETSASWAVPANWGSDTNLVIRFYFDEDPLVWSNPIFWRNYATPSVTDVALDGTGGDTLVVSGTLASFPGDNCVLSVYTGDSPTTLDNAWMGLAGSVRDATGTFTLTLHESDTTAARYLTPGPTVYVTVQAVADGEVARTAPVAVTMSAAPVFASSSSTVSRRTVTFTGKLTDVGMSNAATVTLYVGAAADAENDLVAVETPLTITDTSSFTITHTFPAFETTYKWQLRATATSAGGTSTLETRTAVATCKTLDTTTYTWKSSVHSGNWSDAANWSDNRSGDCLGYPQSSAATAVFPGTVESEVSFTESLAIAKLDCGAGPIVTFSQGGASTNATKLTATTMTWHNNASRGGSITLDGVAIASTSGDTLIDTYRALRLVNGANLHIAAFFGQQARNDVLIADGSYLSCNGTYFGGGTLTISNATFWTRGENNFVGRNVAGGHIIFQGDHPLFYHGKTDKSFYSSLANANVQLDFLVPVGGYATAPIRALSNQAYYMGNNAGNAGSCALTVNVLDESPANYADATITAPLISWPKGINKTMVLEGHLPAYGAATDDAFVWGDATDYPKTLSVTINGASHAGQLQISGAPEAIPSADVSPAYGYVSLAANDVRNCTAPAGYVQVSTDKRAVCTGWKLYDVDVATLARTLADSGSGTSCAVTGTGGWRELEWQWQVEYLVSATAGAGGVVDPASQWVVAGATATVTATPDATHAFLSWTGDVSSATPNGTLSFTVTGPAAIAASFGDAYYVSVNGDDANDGRSWATALRTIKAGIEACPVGGTVFVGPGTYVATSTVKTADKVIHAVYLNKAVRVIAVEGPERTTVDAGTDANRAEAKVCAEGALLAGFSFKNGKNNEKNVASGVEVTAGTVSNCIVSIRGHWAHQGAAFCLTGTAKGYNLQVAPASWGSAENSSVIRLADTAVLDGLVITNFTYGCGPGGIVGYFVSQGGTSKLRNALITNCQMGSIGGSTLKPMIFLETSGTKLEDSTIANNRILGDYGAVHINNAGASVTRAILWDNESPAANADLHGGANAARITQSCSENIPVGGSTGNISRNPQFVDAAHGDWHLRSLSPAAEMGAEWLRPDGAQTALECVAEADAFVSVNGEPLAATLTGHATDGHEIVSALWDFGDGTTSTDWPVATHTYSAVGTYMATLSITDSLGGMATYAFADPFVVVPLTCYLREGSEGTYPYDSWEKATDSLAAALAVGSRHIVVTNGTYDIPAPAIGITRPVSIVSVEGPEKTIFKSLGTTTTNHRHFNIAISDDILVAGFTLLDGYANSYEWTAAIEMSSGTLSNCVVRGTRRVSRSTACLFSGTAKAVDCVFDGHGMTWSNDSATQSGVRITGSAVLDRCEIVAYKIQNNTANGYEGESPVRIDSANAILRNSLVHYCTNGVTANAKHRGPVALLAGRVENCTIAHNVCGGYGGGVWATGGTIVNSIIRDNTAAVAGADIYSTVSGAKILNSCVSDFSDWVAGPGEGCTTKDPNFDPENPYHLTAFSSACIDMGAPLAWHAAALDLDRQPRVANDGVDMGCYEFAGSLSVPLGGTIDFVAASGRVPFALEAEASVIGDETGLSLVWDFGDGTVEAGGKTATHTYATPGIYTVTVTARNGTGETAVLTASTPATAVPQTCYVSTTGGHVPPFASWADASTNVADAVALNPKTVLVTNGTYAVGSDSIVITTDLELRSVNGPDVTILDAKGICRNIWLTGAEAVCDGFRLVRGKGDEGQKSIFARVEGGTLSHCILTNGVSTYRDAAVLVRNGGRMVDCVVDTRSMGGNADCERYWATVVQSGGVIERCVIQNHNYYNQGGAGLTHSAVYVEGNGIFRNCLVKDCKSTQAASKDTAYRTAVIVTGAGTVENCTIVNSRGCQAGAGITISAAANTTPVIRNNIIWGSVSTDGSANADVRDLVSPSAPRVTYSCSPDLAAGEGNLTCDPLFLGAKARNGQSPWALKGSSPLLNAGLLLDWMENATDIAGAPRVASSRPAMGCFESVYSGGTMLFLR